MKKGRRFAACTVVARNYTAFAQVLRASFAEWNPGADFATLVIDGTEEDRARTELGEVLLLSDLGLSPDELEPMVVMYTVVELATALKPATLRAMRARGYDAVAYLDPDIWVLGNLDDVFEGASAHSIVLTPHTLRPVPRDGLEISEKTIMHAGIFNLGFIAVGDGSAEFLDWWHERLRTDAVVDFANALFTDQRWIDWVPALFRHHVSRDPGLNVAYWNVHERVLSTDGTGGALASGAPLRFFHFSGFDLNRPWQLSRFTGDHPRVLVTDDDVLSALCHAYADALRAAGHHDRRTSPYGHARVGDVALTPEVRRVFRDALMETIPLHRPPSHPLTRPAELAAWLREPVQCAPWTRYAPADVALWRSRPDLQRSFPSLFGSASSYYRAWLDQSDEVLEYYAMLGLEPPAPAPERHRWTSGWSVVAAADPAPSHELRLITERIGWELARTGLPFEVVQQPWPGEADPVWVHTGPGAHDVHDNVVVCVDADHFSEDRVVQALADRRGRKVAVWLSSGPLRLDHLRLLEGFDEFWVVNRETAALLEAATSRPVVLVDVPHAGPDREGEPTWLPAAVGPRFLLSVDATAPIDLQNPEAAVTAYTRAFDEDDGAVLVVHVRAGSLPRRAIETLRHLARDRDDVTIVQRHGGPDEQRSVLRAVDAVVSLHRSMPLGVVVRDACAVGTPVVLTGHQAPVGGQVDASRLHTVPFTLVPRGGASGLRSEEERWAEPDVDAAAELLRGVAAGHLGRPAWLGSVPTQGRDRPVSAGDRVLLHHLPVSRQERAQECQAG